MIREPDIERLVERQHGAVSRGQLREAGVNVNTIDAWIRRGRSPYTARDIETRLESILDEIARMVSRNGHRCHDRRI
jgi:hypothetical protein